MNNNYKKITIKEVYGNLLNIEDAVILRNYLLKNIQCNEPIALDYSDVKDCPNYFSVLLTELLATIDEKEIREKILFLNLNDNDNFKRVYYGTSNLNTI